VGEKVALVPTMGYLHDGHLSLVRLAGRHARRVMVSIFVNPAQFGPGEDLERYPRDFARDAALCESAGVDAVFAPEPGDMYPPGYATFVEVGGGLSSGLCGARRPGHFRGVATVVAKLFTICEPDLAVFGQKDAQQAAVIRRMSRDLDLPVEILVAPTVREGDGLAMSSRNAYLSSEERAQSVVLKASLDKAESLLAGGRGDTAGLLAAVRETIATSPLARLDYAEIVDAETLEPVAAMERPSLLALAVFFGGTRLIDNTVLVPKGE
jgi:pantoate--beta-alanine ligase